MNTLPANKETILEVRNLNFFYGAFQGLKNINLDIQKNTVTAFIGPSGCGKSTLLRTLNRMYDLYPGQRAEGEINFDGENILNPKQDLNLLRSRIGMVFQKPTPFPMSIYDNIAFGVKLYENLSRSDMDDRVEWALQKAAIWDEVKNKLNQSGLSLSGGQQQRVAILRAISTNPRLLLLDEVTSALDPVLVAEVLSLVAELRSEGMTMVIATHEMGFARRVADQVGFLHHGVLREIGSPERVLDAPETAELQQFLTSVREAGRL